MPQPTNRIAFVLKGYPRLSETFIAQEIHALEQRGLNLHIYSLRLPYDKTQHPIHDEIRAPITYLPEYLYQAPLRLLRSWWLVRRLPAYKKTRNQWLSDLCRDRTTNRGRRFGQALILAAELDHTIDHLHAHFLHTPASVARYTASMRSLRFSISAHAKDIWTIPDWEITEKLAQCRWLVTCTAANVDHLRQLTVHKERVSLVYHGLDLERFPAPVSSPQLRSGRCADAPVRLISVGRLVEKKGYDILIDALSTLSSQLHWRFDHIGGGPLQLKLANLASEAGIDHRIHWHGAKPQSEVLALYRDADLFVLPSRITADGDRDGLPNVLMEAQSQRVCCLSTTISGIPELIVSGENGVLVAAQDPKQLATALENLITHPETRNRLADNGLQRLRQSFSLHQGIDDLFTRFTSMDQISR